MEFKKRKENTIYRDPLEICKAKFKVGINFNNGAIIDKPKQSTVYIYSISGFVKNNNNDISMKFENKSGNNCTFTVYRNGKYADIIL